MGHQGEVLLSSIPGYDVFVLFCVLCVSFSLFIALGSYLMQSISLYAIASRRGIKHPWLSWLPVGNLWILGCISDQYQYVVKRQVKNKRKLLLSLGLVTLVLATLLVVLCGIMMGIALELEYGYRGNDQLIGDFLASVFGIMVVSLLTSGLSIAVGILQYICMYDLYTSCEPSNNITYLVLSIFLPFSMPILVFICRNKDLGMPPRKTVPDQIPAEPAAWQPAENQEKVE